MCLLLAHELLQKWGWTSSSVGGWLELSVDTRASHSNSSSGQQPATAFLGYVRSWHGMGQARVQCMSGCQCEVSRAALVRG